MDVRAHFGVVSGAFMICSESTSGAQETNFTGRCKEFATRPRSVHYTGGVILFREWDVDGDGSITRKEFHKAMPLLGFEVPKEEIDGVFDEFDVEGGGSIRCFLYCILCFQRYAVWCLSCRVSAPLTSACGMWE